MLVATPGRLLDLCNQRDCDLSHVEVLVLDEADRMLDMGFWPDVKRIMNLLPEQAPEPAVLGDVLRRMPISMMACSICGCSAGAISAMHCVMRMIFGAAVTSIQSAAQRITFRNLRVEADAPTGSRPMAKRAAPQQLLRSAFKPMR